MPYEMFIYRDVPKDVIDELMRKGGGGRPMHEDTYALIEELKKLRAGDALIIRILLVADYPLDDYARRRDVMKEIGQVRTKVSQAAKKAGYIATSAGQPSYQTIQSMDDEWHTLWVIRLFGNEAEEKEGDKTIGYREDRPDDNIGTEIGDGED